MGKPFGKASTCLREAASAKAGANLYTKRHSPSLNKLDFTKSENLRSHKNSKTTAFRSLEGRFAHGRYATVRFTQIFEGIVNASMDSRGIEVILYDLGNVILPFHHYQIAERLATFSQKKESQDPRKIFSCLFNFENGMINRYEEGKISSLQFFLSLRESFDLSLPFEAFVPIWNDIFIENPEVSEMILSQRGKWRLGLLSNTNLLHFNHILSTFPIVRAFDRWILSHEVGFKKPAVEIFRKAMEWAGVEPGKILFIDDMKNHVEVAISLGMQGIHFISARQLKEELSKKLTTQG